MTNALNNIAIEDFGPAFEKVMDMTRFDTLPGWSGKPRGSARGLSDIFTK